MKKTKLWFKEFLWTFIPSILIGLAVYKINLTTLKKELLIDYVIFWLILSAVTATNVLLPQYRMVEYWRLNKQNPNFLNYNESYKIQRRIFFIFWRKVYDTWNKEIAEDMLRHYLKQ